LFNNLWAQDINIYALSGMMLFDLHWWVLKGVRRIYRGSASPRLLRAISEDAEEKSQGVPAES
jgi:hypothetical protein